MADSRKVFVASSWREVYDEATNTTYVNAICEADRQCKLVVEVNEQGHCVYSCENSGCPGDCELAEETQPDGSVLHYCTCAGADGDNG
jgi:hypothetical protein